MIIPRHISDAGRSYYESAEPIDSDIDLSDPHQAQTLRDAVHPAWAETKNTIGHEYELTADCVGDVPGFWINTPNTRHNKAMLLHLHGGAYVLGSAFDNAALAIPEAQIANAELAQFLLKTLSR